MHSAFSGNPIIGDEKYGGGKSRINGYIPEISKKLEQILNIEPENTTTFIENIL